MPNIEYQMHKFGANVHEDGELVMLVEWEEDAAGDDAYHYYLIGFGVFHPSYSGAATIGYGNVLIAPATGSLPTCERAVYCDGDYIGQANCEWLMYHVALLLEGYYRTIEHRD